MNKYYMQYSQDGVWVAFVMLSTSIYEALDWIKENVQERGVCATKIEDYVEPEEECYWDRMRWKP